MEENKNGFDEMVASNLVPIKAWTRGVPVDPKAQEQLKNTAMLPIIHPHMAVMPDVHWGLGATIGSVIPTKNAIIPAAVGVDIGCGMMAVCTTLTASDLPDSLSQMRANIEKAVPHGKTLKGKDRGSWHNITKANSNRWQQLRSKFENIASKHPMVADRVNHVNHLGTLGSGNHFIEVCLDEAQAVWFMLHSGSRGVGNRIGTYFIELAKNEMGRHVRNLPDKDLAYFKEGNPGFSDYVEAVEWAQHFARVNRDSMMDAVIQAVSNTAGVKPFKQVSKAINCHHNYVNRENHFGESLWVTRKGAVRAGLGELGIIPGSMGDKSFIIRGKGNPQSFHSCSHGAGRVLSRTEAKKRFGVEEHVAATAGVECRKDEKVLDETPGAYKSIDAVMKAQEDLVEIAHTLKQVICIKG